MTIDVAGYRIDGVEDLLSPSLVIFRDRVRDNLANMVRMAGSPDRLRPHVKTHKMPELVRMAGSMGITKHKCATIAEAEMLAEAGGSDILLAYPVVGPNLQRLAKLRAAYPHVTFRATVDHPASAWDLSEAIGEGEVRDPLPVLVDLDIGMGRTGIVPGPEALELYRIVHALPNLEPDGIHAYDGHVRDFDPAARAEAAAPGLAAVHDLRSQIEQRGLRVPRLVLGGTPTFPIHAKVETEGVECSPGTTVLHDDGYATKFPDLPFTPAALLLTRVISQGRPGRMTLDLGHKAVAADPVGARLRLLGADGATLGGQSEEHLVVESPDAAEFPPGTPLLAIPTHVCPTVALHAWAYVVEDGKVVDRWEVPARQRVIRV